MQCMKSNARRSCSCYASPGPWWWTWLWYVGLSSNYIHVGIDIVWHSALYVNISYRFSKQCRSSGHCTSYHACMIFPAWNATTCMLGQWVRESAGNRAASMNMTCWHCMDWTEHDMLAWHGLNLWTNSCQAWTISCEACILSLNIYENKISSVCMQCVTKRMKNKISSKASKAGQTWSFAGVCGGKCYKDKFTGNIPGERWSR